MEEKSVENRNTLIVVPPFYPRGIHENRTFWLVAENFQIKWAGLVVLLK